MGLFEFFNGALSGVFLAVSLVAVAVVGVRLKKMQLALSRQRSSALRRVPSRRC
jgi:hypothetical protein